MLAAGAATPAQPAAPPAWRDASATLPAKPAPGHSMGARAADMDSDGDLDLVIAMEREPNRLLMNDGRGRFTDASARLPRAARDSEEVALVDVDRDGDRDVVIANEDDLRPELYLSEGRGTRFVDASARVAARVKANGVVAFDADADGLPDLLFGGDKVSTLFMNRGRGVFVDESLTRLPDTYAGVQDAAAGDIDGDRDLDLVFGAEDRNQIWLNDGKGVFALAPAAAYPRPAQPEETRDVELIDLDRDGDLDLVLANVVLWNPRAAGGLRVLLNDGKGRFTDASAAWVPAGMTATLAIEPVDLDRDGRIDLVLTTQPTRLAGPGFHGRIVVLMNRADRLEPAPGLTPPDLAGTVGFDATAGDFDGDGRADLFISGRAGPDLLLLTRPGG
jgi:hypothetical protein